MKEPTHTDTETCLRFERWVAVTGPATARELPLRLYVPGADDATFGGAGCAEYWARRCGFNPLPWAEVPLRADVAAVRQILPVWVADELMSEAFPEFKAARRDAIGVANVEAGITLPLRWDKKRGGWEVWDRTYTFTLFKTAESAPVFPADRIRLGKCRTAPAGWIPGWQEKLRHIAQ